MGMIRTPTADHRITGIMYQVQMNPGNGQVAGDLCPHGKIWVIEAAGIFTDETTPLEWMLQIHISRTSPEQPDGKWLCPLHRNNGTAFGTPTLALARRVVLVGGQTLRGRVNGLSATKYMGLMFTGWEMDEVYLPYMLGFPTIGGASAASVD